jgi:hypothetical protein
MQHNGLTRRCMEERHASFHTASAPPAPAQPALEGSSLCFFLHLASASNKRNPPLPPLLPGLPPHRCLLSSKKKDGGAFSSYEAHKVCLDVEAVERVQSKAVMAL